QYNRKRWEVFQWISTGLMWSSWIMQDTANEVVFLPRQLDLPMFIVVVIFSLSALGLLLYLRGGKIQAVVTEKTDIIDIRTATLVDWGLAFLLIGFKAISTIPMSTTWVFLGLLAGRELALTRLSSNKLNYTMTLKVITRHI